MGLLWYKDYAILTWASTFTCWTSEISLKSYGLVIIMRFGRNCNPCVETCKKYLVTKIFVIGNTQIGLKAKIMIYTGYTMYIKNKTKLIFILICR